MLDPLTVEWGYSAASGQELRREAARKISAEAIQGLCLTRHEE